MPGNNDLQQGVQDSYSGVKNAANSAKNAARTAKKQWVLQRKPPRKEKQQLKVQRSYLLLYRCLSNYISSQVWA